MVEMDAKAGGRQLEARKLQSKVIDVLRFPMAVLVVLLHASFMNERDAEGDSIFSGFDSSIYEVVDFLFVNSLCAVAVPLFFFISGYLFFCKGGQFFGWPSYAAKIRRRFGSLFVPYVAWNALVILFLFVVQCMVPSMMSGSNKAIADYSVADYLCSFLSMSWVNPSGINVPVNGPLWFIRDLMVLCLLSPLVFCLSKWLKWLFPLCAMAYWLADHPLFLFPTGPAVFFFSLGAWIGIRGIGFVECSRRWGKWSLGAFSLAVLLNLFCRDALLGKAVVLFGVVAMVYVVALLVERKLVDVNRFLTGSTFFLFAAHYQIIVVLVRLLSKLGVQNQWFYLAGYFLCPLLVVSIVLCVYALLNRYAPRLSALLSGGR